MKAVIANRFQVMSHYYKAVIKPILKQERRMQSLPRAGRLLRLEPRLLTQKAKIRLQQILASCEQLQLVYQHQQALQNVWLKAARTQKELVEALQQWCHQAEESGLDVLKQFAQQLKNYVPA